MEIIPIVIDVIIIAIPILSLFNGKRKGFAAVILPLLVTAICIFVASSYAGDFAKEVSTKYITPALSNMVEEKFNTALSSGEENLTEALPDYILKIAEETGYSIDSLIPSQKIDKASGDIANYAEKTFIIPALTAIFYIVIFILSKALGKLLVKPANLIAKLPVIKSCNKLLGAVAGFIQGILGLVVLLVIAAVVMNFFKDSQLIEIISNTHVLLYLIDKSKALF